MSAALILDLIKCIEAATESKEVAVPSDDWENGFTTETIEYVNPYVLKIALQALIP
jgi:hypothetical protein